MLYQQGDILFQSVDRIPDQLARVAPTNDQYVIAKGEATGHAHVVSDPIGLYSGGSDELYCVADDSFTVRHEEHHPLTIPPGLYIVKKVRQYDYFSLENYVAPVKD